jgi:O-antigen/teichoic acid export membrane protein
MRVAEGEAGRGTPVAAGGLARSASITFAARVAALLLGIAGSVIVARALGPAGRGQYALIILIPTFLQVSGGLGLDQAMVYLVARSKNDARSIAFTLASASAGLGLILIAAYGGISQLPLYTGYLRTAQVDPPLVWILVVLLPVTLIALCFVSAILGLERYRAYNLASLLGPVSVLVLLLALVVVGGLGLTGAVLATGGASLFTLLGAGTLLLLSSEGPIRLRPGVFREALRYGFRADAANLAWFLHNRADMFFVGYLAGPAALGYYATAVGLAEKLNMPPSAVGTVLFPKIAAATGEDARRLTPVACRHTLSLTLLLCVGLALLAWPLIYVLFGTPFLPAVPLLWLLLPGVLSLSVGRLLSADLNGRGLPGSVARVNVAMALVNIALNLWWIPIWGAAGSAAATSVSYTAAVILLSRRYVRESAVGWREMLVLTRPELRELMRLISLKSRTRSADRTGREPTS